MESYCRIEHVVTKRWLHALTGEGLFFIWVRIYFSKSVFFTFFTITVATVIVSVIFASQGSGSFFSSRWEKRIRTFASKDVYLFCNRYVISKSWCGNAYRLLTWSVIIWKYFIRHLSSVRICCRCDSGNSSDLMYFTFFLSFFLLWRVLWSLFGSLWRINHVLE